MSLKSIIFLFGIALLISRCQSNFNQQSDLDGWHPLFDGKNIPHKHHLGRPDPSIDLPGYKRDDQGKYLESLGLNDPLKVFSVDTLDGESVIRISGQVNGTLTLIDSLSNYHLKLKFKWGDSNWSWMAGQPNGGGILYHSANGVRHELQMHGGEIGSYWSKNVVMDVPAENSTNIPKPLNQLRPFLERIVSTLSDTMLVFNPNAAPYHFDGEHEPKAWQIVIANPYQEFNNDEWNVIEIICYKNHAIHKLNGQVNMIVLNASIRTDSGLTPMDHGSIILQSGGSEVFFKDIYVRKLAKLPEEISDYLK